MTHAIVLVEAERDVMSTLGSALAGLFGGAFGAIAGLGYAAARRP
ncbi:MAG: hypothetical protein QOI73_2529, partial [Solirubrobacteraceae bacterium]|nr:hypothetical protein [Solirubrobacteraceae bacterium]